jgi:hypothetical protein
MTLHTGAPAHLIDARRRDSATKNRRVHDGIARLRAAGQRITFARLAREAGVSTWFLYNTAELECAVRTAIDDQQATGLPVPERPAEAASKRSLAADLAMTREELRELRAERDGLKKRLQLTLGAELDAVTREEMLDRIKELEKENTGLTATLLQERQRADLAESQALRADAELMSARLSLKRMVRQTAAAKGGTN